MENDSNSQIVLKGLIVPARWDKKGDVVGIAIACHDEKEYLVLMNKIGRELMAFLNEEIIIIGKLIKIYGREVIKVGSFNEEP
jgi:hypothetical protein